MSKETIRPNFEVSSDPIARWLLCEARDLASSREILGELCQRLIDEGMVLHRMFISARTLHPLMEVIGLQWHRRDKMVTATPREFGIFDQDLYLNPDSPDDAVICCDLVAIQIE
jgi:hypothetical protein